MQIKNLEYRNEALKELKKYFFKLLPETNTRNKIIFKVKVGDLCPHCQTGNVIFKKGKYGNFFACDRYPYCAFSQNVKIRKSRQKEIKIPEKFWAR